MVPKAHVFAANNTKMAELKPYTLAELRNKVMSGKESLDESIGLHIDAVQHLKLFKEILEVRS